MEHADVCMHKHWDEENTFSSSHQALLSLYVAGLYPAMNHGQFHSQPMPLPDVSRTQFKRQDFFRQVA